VNHKPLVSVIVTTFNRKILLKETINSILRQTFKDFELIVVDNYSSYDFFNIINSFNDSRILPFQNKNNGIIAVNRNYGIKKAKGEYIAFCDDDDLWLPNKLEKQINKIHKTEDGMVYTMQKYFGKTSIFTNNYGINPLPFKQNTSTNGLFKVNCIPSSSVMLKKDLLEQIGCFDERKSFIAIEDYDLWIRASKATCIRYIPNVLTLHRVHNLSVYENSNTIDQGEKDLYNKYGLKYKKSSFYNFKRKKLYFFLRNVFLLIIENLFYKTNISRLYT